MKTVNVLTRKMGDFNVFQRTSDGYFEAYELVGNGTLWKGMSKGRWMCFYLRLKQRSLLMRY